MKWIGLTGRMGAGKDYTFEALRDIAEYLAVWRMSFADGLRYEIQRTLTEGLPGGPSLPALWEKPYPEAIRRLLQWWGTDFRREQDPNYWVNDGIVRAKEKAKMISHSLGVPVFTDVRFQNEAEAIRAEGGIIVRVTAPYEVRRERLGQHPPNHSSETAMDDFLPDLIVRSAKDDAMYRDDILKLAQMAEIPLKDRIA